MTNIIEIRQKDIRFADEAFKVFMTKTENYLNEKTQSDHTLYKDCGGSKLEPIILQVLHEICPSTPFRKENINLVSGANFPDIVAERYYGVEVKTTKDNNWKSTGGSIVENTRIKDVDNIYMLFGKLGGEYVEFRCKPYQDCLSNIAVTHSPRYLIDMELNTTIFDKLGTKYDNFRLLSEGEKISALRQYYKQESIQKGKIEMPWWMGEDQTSRPVLSLFSDMSLELKKQVFTRLFILFPSEMLNGDYKKAALWMCSRYSVINPSMRDLFSAGGKISKLGNYILPHKMPQVLSRLYEDRYNILALLLSPDLTILQDINYCWLNPKLDDLLNQWLDKVNEGFKRNKEMRGLSIFTLFEDVL